MKKKLLFVLLALMTIGLTACGTKDSTGKVYKASLNKDKVMMNSDYLATVKLKANKNTSYKVQDKNGDDIQSSRQTKTGRAKISFKKTGKYIVIAQSDNGHVTKKLPVKVIPYSVKLNKTTSSVGPLQFKIKNIKYEQKVKTKEPSNDALYNMDNYKSLNQHYYQITINYDVRNNGDKPVDPQLTMWTPVDDNGTEFQDNGSADSYFYDTVVGGSKLAPKSHRAGVIYMISNDKFSVKNLKLNVGDIFANDDEQIGDSGVVQLN